MHNPYPSMKKAVIALYVIIAVQSVIIVCAFVFTFAAIESGFRHAGKEMIEISDQRYVRQ